MNNQNVLPEDRILPLVAQFCALHGRVLSQRKLGLNDDVSLNAGDRIIRALTSHGFEVSSDTLELELESLQAERGPWFVRRKDGRWELLTKVVKGGAVLRDVAGTDRIISIQQLVSLGAVTVIIGRPRFRTQARVGDFAKNSEGHWFWHPLSKQWRVFRDGE